MRSPSTSTLRASPPVIPGLCVFSTRRLLSQSRLKTRQCHSPASLRESAPSETRSRPRFQGDSDSGPVSNSGGNRTSPLSTVARSSMTRERSVYLTPLHRSDVIATDQYQDTGSAAESLFSARPPMVPERPVTHGLADAGPVQAIPGIPRAPAWREVRSPSGRSPPGEPDSTSRRSLQSSAVSTHRAHSPVLGTCRAGSSDAICRITPATLSLNSSAISSVATRRPGEDLVDPARGERRRRLTQATG